MTPKITDEMRDELAARLGQPVRVEDDRTHKAYYLVAEEHAPGVIDNWVREELRKGFDVADQGDLVEWDPERIKAEGRRRLAKG